MTRSDSTTRRDFLKTSAVAAGTVATTLGSSPFVHAGGNDVIKVGLIGCGGRGKGAAENVLNSAKGVEIVAVGDYFKSQAEGARNHLMDVVKKDGKIKELGNKAENIQAYDGLDAYKRVIETPGVNYIILATSPGFRPIHLAAAVAAGKNIFTEKPVATDGPGIRSCLKSYEEALTKKLCIAAGTQRRHQAPYIETIKQIHDGAIGDIVNARAYWNGGDIWFKPRQAGMSDLDYQIHNWYHFCYLCGDHYVEQHVHNLDVVNWATKSHPVKAVGMGGRVRPYKDPAVDGNIFNFFAVDFEYPNGMHMLSMARQIHNTENNISEALVGTKGVCQVNAYTINGKKVANGKSVDPYVQEHTDLIECIRSGNPINELKNVAESTLTAILGRTAAYTGKAVSWDQALNSKENMMPERLDASSTIPVPPLPVPGKTAVV